MSAAGIEAGKPIEDREMVTVELEHLQAYADASGDRNPIHLDETVARQAGLPGIIAHGMFVAGVIATRGLAWMREHGMEDWKLTGYSNRFRGMVLLGDTLFVGGAVKGVSDHEIVIDLKTTNQKGDATTTGTLRFMRRSPQS